METTNVIKQKSRIDVTFVVCRVLALGFLILYVIALFIPVIWGILTSFKDKVDFYYNMFGLPEKWQFENYLTVLKNFKVPYRNSEYSQTFNFGQMLFNSLAYSVTTSFVSSASMFVIAYATSMYRYKFSEFLDGFIMVLMVLPIYGGMASEIQMMKAFGLFENFFGMAVVAKLGSFTGLWYFIVQNIFKGVPKAFAESAKLDGAGNATVFFRIYIPLTAGMFATLFILHFISAWNDYLTPKIYLSNFPTAAYGLWYFKTATTADVAHVSVKLAASMMLLIPIMILFIIFHEKLMNNISLAEGVKE